MADNANSEFYARLALNVEAGLADELAAKNPAITFMDEGSLQAAGTIESIDFVGSGVQLSVVGTSATVAIAGGGSGSLAETKRLREVL